MTRGTTPRLCIRVKGIDTAQLKKIYLTFKQGETILEKTEKDLAVNDEYIEATLTQEDTLAFKQDSRIRIQLRAVCADGSAVASSIVCAYMGEILKDGAI